MPHEAVTPNSIMACICSSASGATNKECSRILEASHRASYTEDNTLYPTILGIVSKPKSAYQTLLVEENPVIPFKISPKATRLPCGIHYSVRLNPALKYKFQEMVIPSEM
jgi:hypothetical protein